MRLLDVLRGRTLEEDEDAQRPLGLVVRSGGFEIRTAWQDWKRSWNGETEVRGFQPLDPATSTYLYEDELTPKMKKAGLRIIPVAGISNYSGRSLPDFAPGQPVALAPEPENKYDANAIAVRSADGRVLAGYLPRADAKACKSFAFRHQCSFAAVVIWEFRKVGSKGRDGLRLLVGPDLEREALAPS
jgi:HIRAN domain-containing protein